MPLESINKYNNMAFTILIASIKVTLNSLRILAWLFNLLLQACSGGAALSKSSCRKSASQNISSNKTGNQYKACKEGSNTK